MTYHGTSDPVLSSSSPNKASHRMKPASVPAPGSADRLSGSVGVEGAVLLKIPVKRPHSPQISSETYKDSPTSKMSRYSPTMQPPVPFAISPFREMVVKLHPHLDRTDIVKMAYIMELPDTFEKEMGTLRDPLLYLIQVAERVGRVNGEDVDMLISSLVILKKPQDAVQIVREYKEKYLQPFQDASVWKKTTMQPDSEQKPAEKDYTKYWLKFQDWCGRQNILDAKAASCKIVIDYLNSLTSSNKMATVINYYKGILQHHQNFRPTDKLKLETCIKDLKEKEKKTKVSTEMKLMPSFT